MGLQNTGLRDELLVRVNFLIDAGGDISQCCAQNAAVNHVGMP